MPWESCMVFLMSKKSVLDEKLEDGTSLGSV